MKKLINFIGTLPFCIVMVIFCVWFDKQDWIDWTNSWTQPDPIVNELNNRVEELNK